MDGSRMVWPKMPGQVGNFEGYARVWDSFAENQKKLELSVSDICCLPSITWDDGLERAVFNDRGLQGGFTK